MNVKETPEKRFMFPDESCQDVYCIEYIIHWLYYVLYDHVCYDCLKDVLCMFSSDISQRMRCFILFIFVLC